jgi:tetratricopeptide (TPR) repeat protein
MRHHRKRCLRCGRDLPQQAKPGAVALWLRSHWRPLAAGAAVVLLAVVAIVTLGRQTSPPVPPQRSVAPEAAAVGSPGATQPAVSPALAPLADPDIMGHAAYREGDYQAAFERYRDAVARNPNDAESLSNCGQALVRLGRQVEAVPYFERAIALNAGRWAYHFNLAHTCSLLGQWDRAVEEYQAAAALFPDDHVTEYNLGMALHKRGDETTAVEHFRRAIELAPEEADFQLSMAISSERLGRAADAIEAYKRYLEMVPSSPEAGKVRAHIDALTRTAPAPAAPAAEPPKSGTS